MHPAVCVGERTPRIGRRVEEVGDVRAIGHLPGELEHRRIRGQAGVFAAPREHAPVGQQRRLRATPLMARAWAGRPRIRRRVVEFHHRRIRHARRWLDADGHDAAIRQIRDLVIAMIAARRADAGLEHVRRGAPRARGDVVKFRVAPRFEDGAVFQKQRGRDFRRQIE